MTKTIEDMEKLMQEIDKRASDDVVHGKIM